MRRRWLAVGIIFIGLVWIFEPVVERRHAEEPAAPRRSKPDQDRAGVPTTTRRNPASGELSPAYSQIIPIESTFLARIMGQSDPRAWYLLEKAVRSTRRGLYAEARGELEELLTSFPDDKSAPLARWVIGLTYYREGGQENLRKATDTFFEIAGGDSYSDELEDLYKATLIDIGVIELELVKSADPGYESRITEQRMEAVSLAMSVVMEKWPDSSFATEARSTLRQLAILGGRY